MAKKQHRTTVVVSVSLMPLTAAWLKRLTIQRKVTATRIVEDALNGWKARDRKAPKRAVK